jgi:heme/copper-type cytochrome/quinol oxidase subunit 4
MKIEKSDAFFLASAVYVAPHVTHVVGLCLSVVFLIVAFFTVWRESK